MLIERREFTHNFGLDYKQCMKPCACRIGFYPEGHFGERTGKNHSRGAASRERFGKYPVQGHRISQNVLLFGKSFVYKARISQCVIPFGKCCPERGREFQKIPLMTACFGKNCFSRRLISKKYYIFGKFRAEQTWFSANVLHIWKKPSIQELFFLKESQT